MSGEAGICEGCSAHFSLFKRKKICTTCKQDFCQSCLTRQTTTTTSTSRAYSNGTTKERICAICQQLSSNNATVDDIMKYKIKHLRSFLQAKNISTNTCKEKRELADLIIRHNRNSPQPQQQQPPPRPPPPPTFNSQQPQEQQPQQQQPQQNRSFNDTIHNFMSNVQDFVNFNVNAAFNPAAASTSSSNSSPQQQQQRRASRTSSTFSDSTNNNNTNQQQQQQQQQQSTASFQSNINDVLNYIGNQIPPVIQQTFTNNRYTFNNVFNGTPQATPAPPPPPPAPEPSSSSSTSSASTINGQRSNSASATNLDANNENENNSTGAAPVPPLKRRASVSDLACEEDIENLSVRQMKEILASNFVDYKGVCERAELIDRVKILFESHIRNKKLTDEINQQSVNSDSSKKSSNEDELCKICMDAIVDCVLLDCGHMISCTKCGKRLAECPICRKNIIKVVRVFKS